MSKSKEWFYVGAGKRPIASWSKKKVAPPKGWRAPLRMRLAMQIAVRDGGKCQLCGVAVVYENGFQGDTAAEIDHIIPLAHGGTHDPENLRLTCKACNRAREAAP